MPFNTLGIGALYKKVYVHRAATNQDIGIGWQDGLHNQLCEQMPWVKCEEVPTPDNHPLVIAGRKHWKELHEYAMAYPDDPTLGDQAAAQNFLESWRSRIPQYGCSCKKHFASIEASRPVDLSSKDAFYGWTVAAHNDVNIRLGKPLWAPGS